MPVDQKRVRSTIHARTCDRALGGKRVGTNADAKQFPDFSEARSGIKGDQR
jgi:hypothetical protein